MNHRTLLSLAAALVLAASAHATHTNPCEYKETTPEVTTFATGVSITGNGNGTYYVDNDDCQPGCLYSTWVYEETNGMEGLQRADEMDDPLCSYIGEPDTILF